MTNEEAINELKNYHREDGTVPEEITLAIQALETGEIYITGEDYNLYMEGYKAGKRDFSPKSGEWINHRNDYGHNIADCSLCGKGMQWYDADEDGIPRYCWYCGAKMGGKENEKGGAE
jgi:hypothetical protein